MECFGGSERPNEASRIFKLKNPLLRDIQAEGNACENNPRNSGSSHDSSSDRLKNFAVGTVMKELAAHMRERCILGPPETVSQADTPAGASDRLGASTSLRSSAVAGNNTECESGKTQLQEIIQESDPPVKFSRPRLRVCLQPEVGEEDQAASTGASCAPMREDGDSESSDGGEAVKSKTAAFGFLYDDSLDERDSAWVRKELRLGGGETDAVLSCPGCFLPVCYQCQRHESSRGLFRAVAAFHVITRTMQQGQQHTVKPQPDGNAQQSESWKPAQHQQQQQNGHQEQSKCARELPLVKHVAEYLSQSASSFKPQQQKQQQQQEGAEDAPAVNQVFCESCGTAVGWQDADDVFHFTDVIPGEA